MKLTVLILVLGLLTGCHSLDRTSDPAMDLREALISANACSFHNVITADYGNEVYTFQLDASWDNSALRFTITDPATIAGISGSFTDTHAELTFDETVLAFPPLCENMITPVSAPWVFVKALKSGYIAGCSNDPNGTHIYIDDTYDENPIRLEVLLNNDGMPVYAEYIWQDRRILTADIQNFTIR